jgi:hypothetical protein
MSLLGPTNQESEALSVVVVDLMGPFDPPTMTGGKYALTIWDTHTMYSEVKILKTKGEAAQTLMRTVTRWETQVSKTVKILRSDNGGEFESKALVEWIKKKGIHAEKSLPYHHFQNGAAELYNCTAADMGRSLLYDSSLGKQFWGYAFIWSVWTLNQLPNRNTQDLTPYKCFYGEKPQLDGTRVFGSTSYVIVAPEKCKKLDNCAVKGKVVGHLDGSKGWTFWIPATKKPISLAWEDFGKECLPKAVHQSSACAPQLGEFSEEDIVCKQEANVDIANAEDCA